MLNNNYLITGGNGYLGSSLVELLLHQNKKVFVVDNFYTKKNNLKKFLNNKNLVIFKNDIRDYKIINQIFKLNKIDIIIHCAFLVGEEACLLNAKYSEKINVDSSKKLFQLAKKHKSKLFIFVSTCSNYGISKKLSTEKSKLIATGQYSTTKIQVEKFLKKQIKNNTIKCLIIRLGTLYGIAPKIRFDLFINDLIKKVYFKEKLDLYNPKAWRPFLHVRDASRAIFFLSNNFKKNFDILNIVSSNFTKLKVIKTIENLRKKKINFIITQNKSGKRNYFVSSVKFIKKFNFKFKFGIKDAISELLLELRKKNKKKSFYDHPNFSGVYKILNDK